LKDDEPSHPRFATSQGHRSSRQDLATTRAIDVATTAGRFKGLTARNLLKDRLQTREFDSGRQLGGLTFSEEMTPAQVHRFLCDVLHGLIYPAK